MGRQLSALSEVAWVKIVREGKRAGERKRVGSVPREMFSQCVAGDQGGKVSTAGISETQVSASFCFSPSFSCLSWS